MRRIELAALLVVLLATPAAAELGPKEKSDRGVRYVCTGFGAEERADPRWQAYPLKIEFTTADGGYFADVVTTIRDDSGRTVFHAHCEAPWLLLRLTPGQYQVTALALAHKDERRAPVTVRSEGQSRLVIRFPTIKE